MERAPLVRGQVQAKARDVVLDGVGRQEVDPEQVLGATVFAPTAERRLLTDREIHAVN